MPSGPPLTREQLHDIGVRQDVADINTLLWEIKRLRGTVLRADQLARSLGDLGGAQGMLLNSLRSELEVEPCVAEFPRLS